MWCLPIFLPNAADPSATDQLMSSLDKNNDGELNFKESWQLIGHLPNKHGRGSANRVSSDALLQFQACNSLVCVPVRKKGLQAKLKTP